MEENTESRLISQTFFWMFLGLLGTAIVSWYTYSSGLLVKIIINDMWRILLIAEVIVVILFSLLFKKLSPTFVGILYFAYATLNGVTLSSIFYCFELNSVIYFVLSLVSSDLVFIVVKKIQFVFSNNLMILFFSL